MDYNRIVKRNMNKILICIFFFIFSFTYAENTTTKISNSSYNYCKIVIKNTDNNISSKIICKNNEKFLLPIEGYDKNSCITASYDWPIDAKETTIACSLSHKHGEVNLLFVK